MFAATVSAGCKHLAARLPQHPPFGIRPQPCSGAQRAPQNRGPVRREPAAPCGANPPPCSGAHCAPQTCGPVCHKAAAGHTYRPAAGAGRQMGRGTAGRRGILCNAHKIPRRLLCGWRTGRQPGPGPGRLPAAGAVHPPGADKAARREGVCPSGLAACPGRRYRPGGVRKARRSADAPDQRDQAEQQQDAQKPH